MTPQNSVCFWPLVTGYDFTVDVNSNKQFKQRLNFLPSLKISTIFMGENATVREKIYFFFVCHKYLTAPEGSWPQFGSPLLWQNNDEAMRYKELQKDQLYLEGLLWFGRWCVSFLLFISFLLSYYCTHRGIIRILETLWHCQKGPADKIKVNI